MHLRLSCTWILAVIVLAGGCSQTDMSSQAPIKYPVTRTVDQVDEIHGVQVADPYRWLEDMESEETAAWVKAENEVTFKYLESIPARKKINDRLTQLWNYERYGVPFKKTDRYFFFKNDGLQNQSVFYRVDSLDGTPRVALDPNLLSKDGTKALSGLTVSDDGKLLAYGVSDGGSDWQTYYVRDLETGKDLRDEIKWIKFSGADWSKDKKGFYYSRYEEPKGNELQEANYYNKLYYHRIGTPQSADTLIYERPDKKEWGFNGGVTDDGAYLIIMVWDGTVLNNAVFYKSLLQKDAPVVELLNEWDAKYEFIDNDGPVFWFKTDLDAPRSRVIAVDTRRPDRANWREVIPQQDDVLSSVNLVNNTFVASYMHDAHTVVKLYNHDGQVVRNVDFPCLGTASGFGGKRKEKETFYAFTSFTYPTTIFRYDMVTGESSVFKQPRVDFDPEGFVTKQIFYKSKDGTRVPMFITHKKGISMDGSNPTLLYGYGGFDVSMPPFFSISRLVWMEMGGVYAVANIRGGGEYGKVWHDGGRKSNKQNCFDDFIAAAEWLIDNKYTSSKKLAINGGSNGGLLVAACIVQRPDLFGAALPDVGVLDMLRFHKFTIGWAWVSDYGSADDPEEFKSLYAYSPYHNLKKGTHYPPTLLTTADRDDRVVPLHSFKFAAALQAAQGGPAPTLIRIETRAGHGAGKPTWMTIEEIADQYAFLVRSLGMDTSGLK